MTRPDFTSRNTPPPQPWSGSPAGSRPSPRRSPPSTGRWHPSSGSGPRTTALFGVGPDVAAQLFTNAGDNPDRLHQAALAHLGAAPIPASSGRVRRHRLYRGGDRGANHALHTPLCRMRYDQRTRAYVHRRITEARCPEAGPAAACGPGAPGPRCPDSTRFPT
ncbi:transposase [Micromonospora coerulea]|uniref:transposase n=1 Tax=Micromonospora coerulea TaxID=47856 RepID=UPI0027DB5C38|nr:transposase [Micromonospora veneta]